MHYIIVTEFETPSETSCRIKGLLSTDAKNLETYFLGFHINCSNMKDFFEVDISGDQVLQILGGSSFNYSVISQSMAIENTAIGGRTVKIQKLVWTMGK
ncbi:uncharacterized protein LOC125069544 [Vanessa atalanta]|uniref:uncharacterized protein LOC125069544 n=1 Tax=Vanessa atalanta TaxID=42275 RepID=UPI001FCDDD2C|nr:uncharacterized protein LOC125069544 [Vanessa atalanta]